MLLVYSLVLMIDFFQTSATRETKKTRRKAKTKTNRKAESERDGEYKRENCRRRVSTINGPTKVGIH